MDLVDVVPGLVMLPLGISNAYVWLEPDGDLARDGLYGAPRIHVVAGMTRIGSTHGCLS